MTGVRLRGSRSGERLNIGYTIVAGGKERTLSKDYFADKYLDLEERDDTES